MKLFKYFIFTLILSIPVISFAYPVNKAPTQITSSLDQKIDAGISATKLSNDIMYTGAAVLPDTLALYCDTNTGILPDSQATCTRGLWVDIESTLTFSNQMSIKIGSIYFSPKYQKETRRARCTTNSDYKTGSSKPYYMECSWSSDININLVLESQESLAIIEQQSLTFNAKPTDAYHTEQFTGNITYQSKQFQPESNGYDNSTGNNVIINGLSYELKILSSNFNTPTASYQTERITSYGNAISTVSVYPEKLDASFSDKSVLKSLSKQYTDIGQDIALGYIYLFYNDAGCRADSNNSICYQIAKDSSISMHCDDKNIQVDVHKCNGGASACGSDSMYSTIAELRGTWGRVNIDTTCAITVLLPYE